MSDPRLPSRREFLALAAGAFAVTAIPIARSRPSLVRRTVPAMGAIAELAVLHPHDRYAHAAMEAAIAELREVESLMTRFRPDSDIGRANLRAAAEPVPISASTEAVLGEALHWADATGGRFDPAVGRLVELWDVKHRQAPPSRADVQRLAGGDLYRRIGLDARRGAPVVTFAGHEVGLDLGGIACGYGVDRAVATLREWGIQDGYVNVGGDIYALGLAPDEEPWTVGIRSPDDSSLILDTVRLTDAAIATSGDYEQHFDFEGRRYGHILDPASGEPRLARSRTVTVRADRCITADAATTACFGLDRPSADRLLRRAAPGASIVHLG